MKEDNQWLWKSKAKIHKHVFMANPELFFPRVGMSQFDTQLMRQRGKSLLRKWQKQMFASEILIQAHYLVGHSYNVSFKHSREEGDVTCMHVHTGTHPYSGLQKLVQTLLRLWGGQGRILNRPVKNFTGSQYCEN